MTTDLQQWVYSFANQGSWNTGNVVKDDLVPGSWVSAADTQEILAENLIFDSAVVYHAIRATSPSQKL